MPLWVKMEGWLVTERAADGSIKATAKCCEFLSPLGKDVPGQIGDLLLVPSGDSELVSRKF